MQSEKRTYDERQLLLDSLTTIQRLIDALDSKPRTERDRSHLLVASRIAGKIMRYFEWKTAEDIAARKLQVDSANKGEQILPLGKGGQS